MATTTMVHVRVDEQIKAQAPDGHPNSPTYGQVKLPHLN